MPVSARELVPCACGNLKQRRSLRCRSCTSRVGNRAGQLVRSAPHDFTPLVIPRAEPEPLHLPSYLTGLWDGEGCFLATITRRADGRRCATVRTYLGLRADDEGLVRLVADYFRVGTVSFYVPRSATTNDKPQWRWACHHAKRLAEFVVPHFDRYPPHGKKRAEYEVWRQIVCELAGWKQSLVKAQACWDRMDSLVAQLKDLRIYRERAQVQ